MGIDSLDNTASNAWLFRRFGLILGAVALLAVVKAAALSIATQTTRDDGHLIDVAGRQRMLSQRMAKVSLTYRQAMILDLPGAADRRAELSEALDEFRESHANVRDRAPAAGFSGVHPPAIARRFEEMEPVFQRLGDAVQASLEDPADRVVAEELLILADRYLPAMNEIVNALAAQSEQRVAGFVTIAWWGAGLTSVLVLAAGVLIIRPAARVLRRRQSEIVRSFKELQEAKQATDRAFDSNLESLAFNRAILETAADAIVVIDDQGHITKANSAAHRMLGQEAGDLVGQPITRFMPDAIAQAHPGYLTKAVAEGRRGLLQQTRRVVARRANGDEFPIELAISRVSGTENTAFAGVIRDITDREMTERRLAQAEKLESIGSLAAGVAHEINTPLQFVTMNLEFLHAQAEPAIAVLERVDELLREASDRSETHAIESLRDAGAKVRPHDIRLAIDDCVTGSRRITEIVRAMKEYTHSSDAMERLDLSALVEQAAVITRNRTKSSAEVGFDLADRAIVVGNRSAISQVVVNVLVNAADAIDEANLEPGTGRITLSTEARDGSVAIVCRDNGCGMAEHVKRRAFDPFYTTKEVGVGSGQGLAIAYKAIVDQHNGRIEIDSTVGGGTEIRLVLPTAVDRETSTESAIDYATVS